MAVVCYDITNRATFENCRMWVDKAREHRGDDVTVVLVGNKIDNEENRAVSREEGENMAKEMKPTAIRTSAACPKRRMMKASIF